MEIKRNPKAPSNNRSWSTSDDSTLIKMARGGASASEIAKILGRTVMAVTTRKHTLHVDVRLASSKGKGVDVPRSLSVKSRKKRKELPVRVIQRTSQEQPMNLTPASGSKKSRITKFWTKEDDANLLSLVADGKSTKEISEIIGRTPVAINLRKYSIKKSQKSSVKKEKSDAMEKKSAMVLRMEKARNAKLNKRAQSVTSAPINVTEEKVIPASQTMKESDFDALSRIAKSTGATITVVFGK
jgi:DNA-binding CsgD family transcriptional regulator